MKTMKTHVDQLKREKDFLMEQELYYPNLQFYMQNRKELCIWVTYQSEREGKHFWIKMENKNICLI